MPKLPTISELISLTSKHALVTGSASGIGKAIATRFAEAGAKLSLVDLDAQNLERTKKELENMGAKVETYRVDLANKSEIDKLWQDLKTDKIDVLVNNAGIYPFKHFKDIDQEFYQKTMAVNLESVVWMCQNMIRQTKQGAIVNIASIEALLPFKDDLAIYSTSKAAVVALTRALAKEHAQKGIKINAIIPGGIITPGTMSAAKQVLKGNFALVKTGIDFKTRLPMGRMGQADEVARIALVLASELSSYMHGAAIPVDGGFLSA